MRATADQELSIEGSAMARSDEYAEHEAFTWQPYRVKPLPVWAMRMNRDFECASLQGTLRGKEGDWIVRRDDGSTFPIADEIFRRHFTKREWGNHENKESSQSRKTSAEVA